MNPIDTTLFLWLNAGPAPSAALVAFATFMSQAMPGVAGAGLAATAVFGGAGLRRSVLRAVLAMSLSWLAVWAIRRGFPQPRPAALNLG